MKKPQKKLFVKQTKKQTKSDTTNIKPFKTVFLFLEMPPGGIKPTDNDDDNDLTHLSSLLQLHLVIIIIMKP